MSPLARRLLVVSLLSLAVLAVPALAAPTSGDQATARPGKEQPAGKDAKAEAKVNCAEPL
ncbi:MAG: hypothetical protein JRF56_21205, partial [Deltaproteobacteria bacterium]|nr:hypothetical protein [Deltaproteobacteria bacterium]